MDHIERLRWEKFFNMIGIRGGSSAKAREGWGLFRCLGLGKSRPDHPPSPWGLLLSFLNRLCSLTHLLLDDCKLDEGDIPDDIGCLLILRGNNFVGLPESIRHFSKLWNLDLESYKNLQELPPLRSNSTLTNPSKLSSRFTNLDFDFTCENCIALIQDEVLPEGWTKILLLRILRYATSLEEVRELLENGLNPYYIEEPIHVV
ncbi:hypothetical protein DVH24_001370 [Malus domestica]|uniref:Uncharacterized protein n=1 Tax=Malus domestica TaxID=3750 RepID=A0A498K116_MALDO|nr:hypothetical protein DVH24_001370 [Malus domestica]